MIESSVYSLARNSAVVNPVRTDNMESLAPKPAANTARPRNIIPMLLAKPTINTPAERSAKLVRETSRSMLVVGRVVTRLRYVVVHGSTNKYKIMFTL